jgi:DNA-binding transcriptional LysR family regulator
LSLGCAETISAGLTAAIIARMSQQHPRLVFTVESGDAPVLLFHFLRERQCELVIARPYEDIAADLDAAALFHERLTVVVGPKHRYAARRKITLPELASERWLLSRNELMPGSPVATAFEREGLELPALRVVTGSLNLRYALLATGAFVSVVPHSLLHFGSQRGNDPKLLKLRAGSLASTSHAQHGRSYRSSVGKVGTVGTVGRRLPKTAEESRMTGALE